MPQLIYQSPKKLPLLRELFRRYRFDAEESSDSESDSPTCHESEDSGDGSSDSGYLDGFVPPSKNLNTSSSTRSKIGNPTGSILRLKLRKNLTAHLSNHISPTVQTSTKDKKKKWMIS